jgi:hypothetical protein
MVSTTAILGYLIVLVYITKYKKHNLFLYAIGFASIALSMWTYHAAIFIIPVFTVVMLIYQILQKKSSLKTVCPTLLLLVLFGIIFLPFIGNPSVSNRPVSYLFSSEEGTLLTAGVNRVLSVLSSFLRIFNFEFLFLKGDWFGLRHGNRETGILFSIMIIPFIAGVIYIIKRFTVKKYSYVFLVFLLIVCALPSSLTFPFPYGPRLLPIVIPLSIVLALGISYLLEHMVMKRARYVFAVIAAGCILTYEILFYCYVYFIRFPNQSIHEFQKASIDAMMYISSKRTQNQPLYFLNGVNCSKWSHDELKLWYFTGQPNNEMMAWNTKYREQRYATNEPFQSYDFLSASRHEFGNTIINPKQEETSTAPVGAIIVRCGMHLGDINPSAERVEKVFYLYEDEMRDPGYVISTKL